jgi:hypothetical protein
VWCARRDTFRDHPMFWKLPGAGDSAEDRALDVVGQWHAQHTCEQYTDLIGKLPIRNLQCRAEPDPF